jgi:Inner membrane component of T3SS, cytoplasmic domain
MPELQVLNGSLQWKTIPIAGARFLIGRKDSCHLILRDGWVSREHTLIMEPKPGEFRVQDLDSENGTFLNGERIRDTSMKHGDVLRVGRTEMRFMQHTGRPPSGPALVPRLIPDETGDAGLRTVAASRAEMGLNPETMKVDGLSQTSADDGPKSETPRIDLRERVRRLEESLLEGEQANAALAAENSVLKRALARLGVLDRRTGAVDPSKLTPAPMRAVPDAMLRFVTNPLARISFPGPGANDGVRPRKMDGNSNPALLKLGLAGIETVGIRFAEALSRLGYRSAVAVTAERDAMRGGIIDPAWRIYLDKPRGGRPTTSSGSGDHAFVSVMPKIEDVFREAFEGCDRVMLCADAGSPLCAESLTQLAEVVRKSGSQPGAVMFCDPADDHVESHARAKAAFDAARTLVESGRVAPFLVVDQSRTGALMNPGAHGDPSTATFDSLAGALDALLRLAVIPSSGVNLDPAAVLGQLVTRGWSTLGFAATHGKDAASISAAYAHALGPGLMAQAMPPSRARAAFVCTIVGADLGIEESALDAARAGLARLLPQAQRLDGVWHDSGESVRVIALVGGLPFPETFFTHGHS